MTPLQKNWVRLAGVMILVVTLAVFFRAGSSPSRTAHEAEPGELNGLSADIYCEGFFATLLKENAAGRIGSDLARTEGLATDFATRVRVLGKRERSKAEQDAFFEGHLGTVGYIAALDRDDRRDTAQASLQKRFRECEARLAAQGVPDEEKPKEPEKGSDEWWRQNR